MGAVLFGGLSAAEAHDSTTEAYEVEVPVYEWVSEPVMGTREVPVYGLVPTKVEVQRTREVPVYGFVPQQVEVQRTREVPVYKHVPTTLRVQRTRQVPVYGFVPQQVPVQRTRQVPVYKEVAYRVRVAPFRQRVTVQPPCGWVTVYGQRVRYCPTPRTSWRDVYNYRSATRQVRVGTRTETYTTTETQMVWSKTGTRTETYTTPVTKMVLKQTGTRSETYTVTETQMVNTQTGTRTETYDTGATRLVKRDTGRTRTVTRTRTVHAGCPAGYYELDSPDTKAWHTSGGGVTFKRSFLSNHGELVNWLGPLDDNHPNCYTPDQSGIGLSKIVIGGTQYAINAGKVVIDGVTYAVEAGKVVVQRYANLTETLKAAIVAQLKSALERLDETVVAPICTDLLTGIVVSGAAGLILTQALTTAVAAAGIALPALAVAAVATAAVGALIWAGCTLAKPWYTPDAPPPPTGFASGARCRVVAGFMGCFAVEGHLRVRL